MLKSYGYTGPQLVPENFELIDQDAGGKILLNEAVTFFVSKVNPKDFGGGRAAERTRGAPSCACALS